MGAVATFDYAAWTVRYPEFSTVTQPQAQACFDEAGLYLANDGSGPVGDQARQSLLMNMLTAHIASINFGVNGEAPSPLVGRVSSATQGSVSVSADMPAVPGTAAWFMTTKYGAAFWAATAAYRTAHYRPGPRRFFL
jgi:hypothetical protein